MFKLWNTKEGGTNKTELQWSKPSKAGYEFGSKVTECAAIMKHSIASSNKMGSQQGLLLIRYMAAKDGHTDERGRFVKNYTRYE